MADGAEEPQIDEVDLAELRAFIGGAAFGPGTAVPPPAESSIQPPSSASLALPPGFENGPDTGRNHGTHASANGTAVTPGALEKHSGLVGEARAKVVVEQEDPTAPYLAATSWDELSLPKEILDGIFEMGFVKPSKIQEWTLPIALGGKNIIGQAQNGSGKTAAFALAMLLRVDPREWSPQGMCICPTRELATQNHDVIQRLGKFSSLHVYLAVAQVKRVASVDAQVVVGTPGKIQDLCKRGIIQSSGVRIFVVDEADHMIAEEMGPQVRAIKSMMPQEVQVLLFSATWPEDVERFTRSMVPKASRITVQKEDLTLATITQTYIDVGDDPRKKASKLSDIYGALNIGQSIIFVNTRSMALELAKMMKAEGHSVALICGTQKTEGAEQIDEAYRDRIMSEFREGVSKVLISTDLLARGIDVPAVTLVVNYDLPKQWRSHDTPEFEIYQHRIGRTGRFGLKGIAVNLITSNERGMLEKIEAYYKCSIKRLSGEFEEMESLLKNLR